MLTAALAASLAQPALPDQSGARVAQPQAAPPQAAAPANPPQASDTTTPAPQPAGTLPVAPLPPDTTTTAPSSSTAPAAPATASSAAPPANGEIVVSGKVKMDKLDPIEGVNKVSFQAVEGVDKALITPIIHVYAHDIPAPIRLGLHNFFFNLSEPVNAINYLLQLHPGKAFKTVERFGINSTIGVAGLIDVAQKKPFNIHYRPNGFGNTFGYWGIGPGPYLFLPLIGATSVRDLIGSTLDQAVLPAIFPKFFKNPYYVISAGLVTELDYRLDIDAGVERVRKTSNVYNSYRSAYLKSRAEEIEALHGRGPLANGEIGQPPFVRPLKPGEQPVAGAPSRGPKHAPEQAPEQAPPAPALTPAPDAPPPAAAAPPPGPPPPPAFISQPVIEVHPTVQALPQGYRPGGS